jgi:hypothetical protein
MKILNKDLDIQLLPATIVQIDKYAKTGILRDERFVPFSINQFYTNIVFQLQQTGKTLPLDVKNIQLPLYNKQEVDIISANQFIIGYVDVKSEEYYYITNDFYKAAGMQFLEVLTWLVSIIATITILTIIKNSYALLFACSLLMLTWLANIIIKSVLNKKIENAIDASMKTFSAF